MERQGNENLFRRKPELRETEHENSSGSRNVEGLLFSMHGNFERQVASVERFFRDSSDFVSKDETVFAVVFGNEIAVVETPFGLFERQYGYPSGTEFPYEPKRVFMVFPRHEPFGAEGGFRNFGLGRSSGDSGEVDPVESGAIGGPKKRSNVMERAEVAEKKGSFQGRWGENARGSRAVARTGNRLQTEPQGFKYFSHVFGNFFGHRGFDDDEKVSGFSTNGFPLSFDSEFRSRFGIRRDF